MTKRNIREPGALLQMPEKLLNLRDIVASLSDIWSLLRPANNADSGITSTDTTNDQVLVFDASAGGYDLITIRDLHKVADGSASEPSIRFESEATGFYLNNVTELDKNTIGVTVDGSDTGLAFGRYSASDTDIDGLVGGTPRGSVVVGRDTANLVFLLRENGLNDCVAFVSGGGNWASDNTWDTLLAKLFADGRISLPNLPTSAGSTGELWNDSGTVKIA